ncbi:hypothetical protein [Allokutzneria oryzae]|uniref:Transposase n=1 Tax=Allokutzneria oryzae TaxID=1378989 RepID=A0ABV5ZTI1_9PSEU
MPRLPRGRRGHRTRQAQILRPELLAMVELLVRGRGWPLHRHDGAIAEQVVWRFPV